MKDQIISPVMPATPEDLASIEKVCQDYASGWFNADEDRIRQALHPGLVKRTNWHDLQDGTFKLGRSLDAEEMIRYTRDGGGSALQEHEKEYEVTILDVFRDIASAKVSSWPYMDYLHLVKMDGRWQILNVLYKVRQGEQTNA